MTAEAIVDTTQALRVRLETAVGANQVYIGPPLTNEVGQRRVALFLFHVEPNRDLRNVEHLIPAPGAPDDPHIPANALPLDLRFLISVFRLPAADGAVPNELNALGEIIQVLHAEPTLGGGLLRGQQVRLTPEPYPMEELSRVWGLFPQTVFRTSIVYLASPVFVWTGPSPRGRPVVRKEERWGLSLEPPDLFGDRREREGAVR